ncbi:MAG TPA: saccharopine dehydrogenase NADP-binding domain-containing protein [Solirubrobacteraceae bacterium]|nr:saccharopine dehydrogenase NADP-binding domain-containing protein [Solirubrobacteraceae bacterium]
MAGRIVLFGATGYTGDLTARVLVARGAQPVLAARSEARVRALAEELGGLEWALADVARPETVRALVGDGDVLLSTVGPFARWGDPAVEAAIAAGAHYVDSTGEPPFIRRVFEHYGPRAQAAGSALVTALGYDWTPGNLAGALALRDAGAAATRVRIGYFMTGSAGSDGMSGGTRASATGALLEPSFAWRGGRLVTERGGKRMHAFEARPGKRLQAISVGSSEHFALPAVHPGLREVGVYLGWFGPASRGVQAFSLATAAITKLPGARGALQALSARAVKGSTGGPDAAARATTGSLIFAEALDDAGTVLASVRLEGANGYDFTAGMLAWGAQQLAAGAVRDAGALGPVGAFGLDALEAGAAEAGIHRA